MTPIDQATRTAQAGHELLQASGDVIARRLEIVADALRDPMKADLREMSLMGSEKVEALTASASAGLNGAMNLAATSAGLRAVSDGWAFGTTMMKLQAETLAPIHAAAVANAKRLKR